MSESHPRSSPPARGVALAGYFDPRPNTGAHDDLKVRVTLFRQGSVITGFVSYDLCFICMNIIEAVRQKLAAAGMNFGGELIFHAIHTHTAPYPAPFFGSDSTDKEYLADLIDASFRAIRRAYKNLARAELFCAKENNNPLAFNRRYFMKSGKVVTNPGKLNPDIVKPEGPVDEEITVMAIRQDGRISAVLANIVNHTDTIGDDFVSADWPGRMEHVPPDETRLRCPGIHDARLFRQHQSLRRHHKSRSDQLCGSQTHRRNLCGHRCRTD
ncbi:MAG: hypothetical protein V8T87_04350 [Victivallales bacterium]